MRIYLVRHGDSAIGEVDNERPLSETGKKDIQRLAGFISPLNIKAAKILHSEKRRARQTAEIIASSISSEEPMQSRAELDPLHPVIPIIDELYATNRDMILVGHMPFMGKLAAKLITGKEDANVVYFNTGSMLCLEKIGNDFWIMHWMLSPILFN